GRPGAAVVGAGVAGDQPDDDGDLGAVDAQARIPGAACAGVAAVAAGGLAVHLDRPGADGVDGDARAAVAARRAAAGAHPARGGAGRSVPGDVGPVLPVPLGAAADHLAVRGVVDLEAVRAAADRLAVDHGDVGHDLHREAVPPDVVDHDAVHAPRVREEPLVEAGVDAGAGHLPDGDVSEPDVLDVAVGAHPVHARVGVVGPVDHDVEDPVLGA